MSLSPMGLLGKLLGILDLVCFIIIIGSFIGLPHVLVWKVAVYLIVKGLFFIIVFKDYGLSLFDVIHGLYLFYGIFIGIIPVFELYLACVLLAKVVVSLL